MLLCVRLACYLLLASGVQSLPCGSAGTHSRFLTGDLVGAVGHFGCPLLHERRLVVLGVHGI